MKSRVYLDHNASSPLRPEAREAMLRVMEMPGNPSSIHSEGRALRGEIERARASVARLVGAEPAQVYFTSGATEAASALVFGLPEAVGLDGFAINRTEHPCWMHAGHQVPSGRRVGASFYAVDEDGIADLATYATNWPGAAGCLVLQLANSETGVVQPVAAVTETVVESFGDSFRWWICDAVQAAGRLPLDSLLASADAVVVSSHKLGGPHGVGALILRDAERRPWPLLRGGGQERNQRAGTENGAGIAGFGAAAEAALRDLEDMPRIEAMRDRLEEGLRDLSGRHDGVLHIFGEWVERLPNTSCFTVEGVEAQTALMSLDLDGFAVSSGSACSSGKVGPSHVLGAMGVADDAAACAIRVSLGWTNTDDDIPAFLAAYERIVARMLRRAA